MTAVVAAAMMLTGFGGMAIEAANPASGDTNITIGKGASVSIWNGVTGHDGVTSGYISIGENAFAWDGEHTYKDKYARIGTKEYLLDFNQGAVVGAESFFGVPYKYRVTDGTKLAGAIAIGKNTMARTGSVMIGDHTYKGQLGDIEVDPSNKQTLNNGVYSTTLGTSSYNSGSMATVTGALSIASGNKYTNDTQNFGATIYGSLNSIESSTTSDSASGMANSVLGFGNRTQNANASLVWGTGNEVTNSIEDVTFSTNWNKTSASDAQKEIIKAMQDQFAGGSVMAIGGGNKADWATYSQLLGVQNTLTGTEKDVSKLTLINGYKNTVTNAQNTTIIGSNNTATNIKSTIVMGDHNTLEGRKNVISLGNNNTVTADDAVAIGNGTTVRAESGVAIGVDSVADRVADSEKGKLGAFAPDTIPTGEESTWASTRGAVSVGDTANNITRQITNVAAGNEDTDAVNVAQLKQVASQAEKAKTTVSNGTNTTVTPTVAEDGHTDYTVNLNKDLTGIESMTNGSSSIRMGNGGTVTINNRVTIDQSGKISGVAAGEISSTSTDAINGSQLHAVQQEAGKHTKVVNGSNITVEETDQDGQKTYKVGLNKDINVNNVQTNVLNSKYNLSVGTAAADGKMPFFVNSNGAFYAAGGEFVVDKDGSVKAGNVKLNNGVFYKNSALRDGELYVGDADGNYSQITSKNAKLGNVQTNALNSKYNLSVGTAAADGKMPFFVNSNGAFYAAGGEFVVDKDGSVKAGNVKLNNGVFYKNSALRDGELYVGDADGNYSQITSKNAKLGKVTIDDTGRISGVAAGRIAADSTDAINGSQLHAVQQEAGKHTKVVNGSNITVEETDQDGQKTYKVGLNKDLLLGDITGKNVSISGTNGTIETTGSIATKDKIYADKGAKLADVNVTGDTISNDKSSVKLDKDGTVTINNKVTVDQNGKVSGVAAGDISDTSTDAVNGSQLKATNDRVSRVEGDITNIKSDITDIKGDVKNLGDRVTKVEQEAGKHTKVVNGSNITVEETDQDGQKTYKVGLNKDLLLGDITGKNVSISGTNGTIETTGSIATKDKIYADKGAKLADIDITGDTISNGQSSVKLDKEGTVTINGKVSVNQNGKVSGVAAGDISSTSTDAVNGSQLFATNQQVVQNAQSISKLGNRINKVGAGAAALAALHPLDFDPDDKWDFAAGYGNYNGENAVAIGAYYRPNEDTMFSVGGSFGNGENMVNAGVSLKLGQGNHVSTSKVAMAKEIKDLRKEMEGLKSALLDANAGKKLDTSKLQLFPDVPKNHWAYEYVSTLKGNGMLTGYPDGEFKGDRPMTRYEFATMLYKAMLEGATLSDKILKEFAPELERFTVDTVHQDKDGKPTVERVRMVKAAK